MFVQVSVIRRHASFDVKTPVCAKNVPAGFAQLVDCAPTAAEAYGAGKLSMNGVLPDSASDGVLPTP